MNARKSCLRSNDTYKDETLFELGEDGYLLYITLYIIL